ncbi:MAG: AmmeMemoRadiSam system radical SAM enzyme [Pseudomonadota bacterium]
MTEPHPARWFEGPDGRGKIRCTLCPRDCRLGPGQAGFCFIRQNQGGHLVTLGHGVSTGFAVDPIEKKPLFHFYPGTSILSFGTAGCNLGCRFCQNWTSSKAHSVDRHGVEAAPAEVVDLAVEHGVPSIAFTYNDPVIFAEYAIDVARIAHQRGVHTVAVTAGYISPGAREEFFGHIDAANVDLKSMDASFYKKMCAAKLGPVLDTLEYLAKETQVWVELTNLVIPGHNDSDDQLERLARWVVEHMGPEVPVHFSAFHPDFKLTEVPRTPPATLQRARDIATQHGLRHVYTGNVHDPRGQSTFCPQCQALLVGRSGYHIESVALDDKAACLHCGSVLAGRFGPAA